MLVIPKYSFLRTITCTYQTIDLAYDESLHPTDGVSFTGAGPYPMASSGFST